MTGGDQEASWVGRSPGCLGMDPERAEVAVVDPQRLDELVGVGQGVDVGAADPVDVTGSEDGAGRLAFLRGLAARGRVPPLQETGNSRACR